MARFHKVSLTDLERKQLIEIIKKGKHTSQTYKSDYILLNTNEGVFYDKVINTEISKN